MSLGLLGDLNGLLFCLNIPPNWPLYVAMGRKDEGISLSGSLCLLFVWFKAWTFLHMSFPFVYNVSLTCFYILLTQHIFHVTSFNLMPAPGEVTSFWRYLKDANGTLKGPWRVPWLGFDYSWIGGRRISFHWLGGWSHLVLKVPQRCKWDIKWGMKSALTWIWLLLTLTSQDIFPLPWRMSITALGSSNASQTWDFHEEWWS